jgi:hypothetical protein
MSERGPRDDRDLFDRTIRQWSPPEPAMDRLLRRRDIKRRNQRIGTIVVALVVALVGVAGALASLNRSLGPRPGDQPITRDNVADLRLAWSANLEGRPTGLAAGIDAFYVATNGGHELQRFPLACGVATTCRPDWFVDASAGPAEGVWTSPDGHIYLASDRLYAFAECGPGPVACPAIATGDVEGAPREMVGAGDSVIVSTGDNRLYSFPGNGCGRGSGVVAACDPEWVSRRTTTQFSHPVVVGDTVIVSETNGPSYQAYPLRCATGGAVCDPSATWSLPEGWLRYSPPTVSGDLMYMTVWSNTHAGIDAALLAYPSSCATGGPCRAVWRAPVDPSSSVNVGTPVVADGRVIVAMFEGTVVQAFPTTCGERRCRPLWTGAVDPLLGNVLNPIVVQGVVFVPGQGGGATAFPMDCPTDGSACAPLWTDPGEGAPVTTNVGDVALAGNRIVVAGGEGDAGRIEVFTVGGSAAPAETSGREGAALISVVLGAVVVAYVGLRLLRRRRRPSSAGDPVPPG